MKHPSDYYVRYLLACSWGDEENPLSLDDVNLTLLSYGLPGMDENQFEYLRSTFLAPEDFHFNMRRHPATIEFMKREKIYTIWNPNQHMKRVLEEMLEDRRYQHAVHILLMGDLPSDVIAEKISKKFRLAESLTPDMIDLYRHYFWKVGNLTPLEWERFLQINSPEHVDEYLASLLCGEQQALFRAGFAPKYDYKSALRDTHRQISFRIQAFGFRQDDKATIDLLIKMSREQRSLYDILFGEGGGFEEQVKEIRRFMMEHNVTNIKGLEDLVGKKGSYSGDGGKKAKSEEPEQEGDDNAGNADA